MPSLPMRSVKTSGFLIAAAKRTSLTACRSSSGTSDNPVRLPALSSVIRFVPSLRTTAWLSSFLATVRDGALGGFMPANGDLRPGIVVSGEGWTGIGLDRYNYSRPQIAVRSEEHTSELQSHLNLVCR